MHSCRWKYWIFIRPQLTISQHWFPIYCIAPNRQEAIVPMAWFTDAYISDNRETTKAPKYWLLIHLWHCSPVNPCTKGYYCKRCFHAMTQVCPLLSRLVIYSSYEVQTPYDDWACKDNCYEPCGAISQVDQFTNVGDTLTLRFFHVRLSDIVMYTGNTAKKVREAKAFFHMMSYTSRVI